MYLRKINVHVNVISMLNGDAIFIYKLRKFVKKK